ncbi:putative uncharacterized protein DDB_G0282133 [Melanaphis sacchari]|uniref:putative uncharacterized protein DDB_G0282133 n=1 Tax=Melanaphis sacchari TaxID=742174 RepID=UPI000DC15052|nr:putative uncharacterized protein DDB_G0282133 [Melanaphis sacchari]
MDSQKSVKTYYGFLLIKKGNGSVCGRFPVTKKECILGRDNNCDIRILLEKVSAQQCSILCIDNKAYVRDKSIAGSTKVNGKKVGRSNFLLHNSDEIEICERKFVWEYPKKPHGDFNNLSCKKSGIRNEHLSPRVPERFLNQVITPLDNKKIFSNSSKSSMKTPSKTIMSLNKTPIVVTTENMSKSSFDEVQNNLQNQNSTSTAQSGSKLMKSYSMTPVRNIPLLRDSKSTQRKSWVVTNTSDNLSSIGAHNRLSTQRLKRDSTPELSSSYHYEDEGVEFDSPDPPSFVLNTEHSININTNNDVDNQSELNEDNDNLQSNTDNKLTVSEPEPSTSRRDTYSIDDRSIVIEENTTPAPRRSILKCSKTTKPNRSRSSCRMVQFARLPKTDSKIKNTKTRLNPGFSFTVTDDENNLIDFDQSTKNSMQFNVEEYDDDLDGVQPLDNSVSSLINSPILDNNINKSSKRGSRGNKVMSLVNSIEKRTNESPKHSIRASDLLSMNGSKHIDISPNNNSQNNPSILQESVSSSRRINLEDIFEAEDSLKTSGNIENEIIVQETKKSPLKSVELVSNPNTKSLNITETEKIPVNVFSEDESINDVNDLEYEYTFASPLKLPSVNSNSIIENDNDLTFDNAEKNSISTEIINRGDTNSKLHTSRYITEDCTTSISEILTKSNDIESHVVDHELNSISPHDDNIDETQKNNSKNLKNTMVEEICTNNKKTPKNITVSSKINNSIEKDYNHEQKDDSEFVNDNTCINEVSTSKNDAEFANKIKAIQGELDPQKNDSVKLVDKPSDLNFDQIDKQNNVSKIVEQTPSIVVQSMSEMFNGSIDEHETTHSQHKESLVETYILVGKDNLQNSLEINEINLDKCNKTLSDKSVSSAEPVNKSLMDAIEVQLDKIHSNNDTDTNCNENKTISVNSTLALSKQKTSTSNLVLEETDTEKHTLKINSHLSNNSLNTLTVDESTEIICNSGSISKSLEKDNASNNCLTNIDNSNISELFTNTEIDEPNSLQNINVNNKESNCLSKTIPSDNLSENNISLKPTKKITIDLDQLKSALGANNSKELRKSNNPEHSTINSTKMNIAELMALSSSSDDDDDDDDENDQNKSSDHLLDTSIGRPRYESTPWNWSKNSKTPFNSTTSTQPNEITKDNSAENEDRLRDRSSTPVQPFDSEQQSWSQLMKDFNESVKKASVTCYTNINKTGKHKKKLFVKKSKDSNIKNNKSEIKNNNSTQGSTSLISNYTSNESVQAIRPIKNESTRVRKSMLSDKRRSTRSSKIQSSYIDNYDSAETSNTDEILLRKNNSIDNKTGGAVRANTNRSTKSKSLISISKTDSKSNNYSTSLSSSEDACSPTKKITNNQKNNPKSLPSMNVNKIKSNNLMIENVKVQIMATKDSPSSSEDDTSCYLDEIQTFERELRRRKLNNYSSSIKTKKNTLNSDKVKTIGKSRRNTSSTKTCNTDSNNALSESSKLKLDKKNKTTCAVKSKSIKISKTVKTKKSTNLRANKNTRSKRLLPSKPIKTSSKNSSEYESSNETEEESTQKLQSLDLPKSVKGKTQKKDIYIDNNLLSLPTRRSQRGKIKISDVSMQSRTQSRKRAANISPLTQNNKDKKKNILSKAVASPVSQTSYSPKKSSYTLPKQNSAVNQVPDKSLPETTNKSTSLRILRTNKNAQLNHLLPSKSIKTSVKDSLKYVTEESTQKPQSISCPSKSTKEKTKKKDIIVDNNLSSVSTKRNLREKNKTSDVSLQPPKIQSRKRAADSSPLSQPKAKGKKCDILSKVANSVSRASNSPNIRTRNMSKISVKQTSDNSLSETTSVSKREKKKSNEKLKPKSNENTRAKKRQLNSDDSASSTCKKVRQVTFKGAEIEKKKSDLSTEPIESLKVKYNKNAEKSISPVQRKTRKAKQAAPKDKETIISPRVLRVRDKKK